MTILDDLQKKYPKYSIEYWVADYGIYDNEAKGFIGVPINSFFEAERMLLWFLTFLDENRDKSRENMQTIGLIFIEWGEQYFNENTLNIEIPKNLMLENLANYSPFMKNLSSINFKTKLKSFCELKDLYFNSEERIIRNISGKTTEMILVQSKK